MCNVQDLLNVINIIFLKLKKKKKKKRDELCQIDLSHVLGFWDYFLFY